MQSIFVPMLLGHRFQVPAGVVRKHKFPDDERSHRFCKKQDNEALVAATLLKRDGIGVSTIHMGVNNGCCQRTVRLVVNRFVMLKYVRYSEAQNRFGLGRNERKAFVLNREALEKIARRLEK